MVAANVINAGAFNYLASKSLNSRLSDHTFIPIDIILFNLI
jgi:hypothetical protein